jgi:hypothetical protein
MPLLEAQSHGHAAIRELRVDEVAGEGDVPSRIVPGSWHPVVRAALPREHHDLMSAVAMEHRVLKPRRDVGAMDASERMDPAERSGAACLEEGNAVKELPNR